MCYQYIFLILRIIPVVERISVKITWTCMCNGASSCFKDKALATYCILLLLKLSYVGLPSSD